MERTERVSPSVLRQARAALVAGEFDEVLVVLSGIAGSYAAHPDAHVYFTRALVAQGRLDEAVDHLRAACAAHPADARLRVELAEACLSRGLGDEALATLERAMDGASEPAVLLKAASSAFRLKRGASAAHYAEEAVRRFPDSAEAHFEYARILARARDWDRAIHHLGKALETETPRLAAELLLAQCLSETGRHDRAEAVLSRVKTTSCTTQQTRAVMKARINVLARAGALSEAADLCRTCIEGERSHAPYHYRLYELERDRGRLREAAEAAKIFCELSIAADTLAGALGAIDTDARCSPAWEETTRLLHQRFPQPDRDFSEWRRRAVWGERATEILRLWWYGRPGRAEEIDRLIESSDLSETLRSAPGGDRGLILVGSHFGPFPAATRAMQKTGLPFRTFGNPQLPLQDADADFQIAIRNNPVPALREMAGVLRSGGILGLVTDLAQGERGVEVEILGGRVELSSLAPRAAFSYRVPTLWVQAYWKGESIEVKSGPLPHPGPGESRGAFVRRWAAAYARHLQGVFLAGPENLRPCAPFWDQWLSTDAVLRTEPVLP
ncbi:tetratricopeptide repeat protein [Marinicauda algicola]|nr:tetratricopeptide repeat protein [Marinicauda algicola]